jgi:hypothetical protein
MGIPDGDLSPRGTETGNKCPPQAFVGIPAGKFFRCGDEFGELKPDGEFPVAIPTYTQRDRLPVLLAFRCCFVRSLLLLWVCLLPRPSRRHKKADHIESRARHA